jgi:hypothetical protein
MNEKPISYKEVVECAKRAAERIEKEWPKWKKDLSIPRIISVEK